MTSRRSQLSLLFIVLLGAILAHRSHRLVDELRYQEGAWDTDRIRPNGQALRTASMGYHTLLTDILWLRTVLLAADIYDDPDPAKVIWLRESLLAMSVLDPEWRTLYFYGGGFLQVTGDIEGSNQIFELGMKFLPEDPYFPFSRGMNSYLYPDPEHPEDSKKEAAEYLRMAAELPGAPGWYKGTVAIFLDEAHQRSMGLEYLEEQIENETRPRAREVLLDRWAELMHDELAEEMEEFRESMEARGVNIHDPQQMGQLADDPLGGEWIMAPDGRIRSSLREEKLALKARLLERETLTHAARKAWSKNH
jgi:hypothetical protein